VDTACAWVRYLESDQLFDLLDFLEKDSRSTLNASALPPINVVLDALSNTSAFESQAEQALIQRLPQLLSLKSVLSDSHLLEQVIAIAIEASLPVSLDGHSPVSTSSPSGLITVIKRAESRWARRNQVVGVDIDIRPFLMQDAFSDSTAKIISCLLYRQPSSHQALVDWLNPESLRKHDARYLVPILYAFVDSSTPGRMPASAVKADVWLPFMSKIVQVIADVNVPSALRRRAQDCLICILSASGTDAPKLLDAVAVEMKSASRSLSYELLSTGVKLSSQFGSNADSVVSHLVDHGLQWCIDQFAGGQDLTGWESLIRGLGLYGAFLRFSILIYFL
jgi:nucleolar pre-ribosomal-associated protein 1